MIPPTPDNTTDAIENIESPHIAGTELPMVDPIKRPRYIVVF